MLRGPADGGPFGEGGPRGLTGILERHVRGTTPFWLRSILAQRACGICQYRIDSRQKDINSPIHHRTREAYEQAGRI